jgi:hypothetical protein
MTKEYFHKLEDWEGGKANGYYEPLTDEIHILRSESMMFRVLLHERIHASRRKKLTCKVGALISINPVRNFMFLLTLIFASLSFTLGIMPFLIVAGLFMSLIFCSAYEEFIVDSTVSRSVNQIKFNGEKEEIGN